MSVAPEDGDITPGGFDPSFETYMVIVAHPDDMEFSSAGTVARLAKEGKRTILIQVTSGDKGSSDPSMSPHAMATTREAEEREACRRLGVEEVVFLRCTDGELMPDLSLRERIVRMIRTHKPDVVISHDGFRPYALHPDHRAVGLATTDSVYPAARDPHNFSTHLREGLEPHKTAELWLFGAEQPDKHIDVTDTFAAKIDALLAHESQVGTGDGMEGRLRERATELAADQPFELAEAFKVIQMRR
ncbi:MAG: PIG-L family deacetylase [Chloroflexota bacterium]|nr:PIG-L family deacetylase [Chloroflexota bacterium]MDQ3513343.1 PIG-L family deacetylase [Chloroflexota bacterium]